MHRIFDGRINFMQTLSVLFMYEARIIDFRNEIVNSEGQRLSDTLAWNLEEKFTGSGLLAMFDQTTFLKSKISHSDFFPHMAHELTKKYINIFIKDSIIFYCEISSIMVAILDLFLRVDHLFMKAGSALIGVGFEVD